MTIAAPLTSLAPATHPVYRPDIDGLRAVAVLGVLVYHAFPQWLDGGFAGVDVFFVISGFLITGIVLKSLSQGRFSLADFYARRIVRLFPVLLVVLFFSLMAGAFVFLPADYEKLGLNVLGGAAFVANWLLAADAGYFAGIAEFNPVLHLWSLGIEEQFYLVWPVLLWLSAGFRRTRVSGGVIAALIVASFAYSQYLVQADRSWAFYSPLSRFWELGAGGLLAWLLQYPATARLKVGAPVRHLASLAGLVCVVLSFVVLSPGGVFPGVGALLPVVGAVLLIAAGPRAVVNRLLLSHRLMVGIGLISYPLYLWHWPLLAFAATVFTNSSDVQLRLIMGCMLGLSMLLAWLSYRFIERPLRQKGPRAGIVVCLACAMVGVAAIASTVWALNGVPQRLPVALRDVLATDPRDDRWKASLRPGVCHNMIYSSQGLGAQNDCYPAGHPSLMVWGDSHAAALSAGFRARQGSGEPFALWQYTTDATPPLFASALFNNMRRSYTFVNAPMLDQLRTQAPDTLLLHAFWVNKHDPANVADLLENAVRLTRLAAPQTRIVVLGPVPAWRGTLQQNIINYYWQHGATAPGNRMTFGLLRSVLEADAVLQARMKQAGVPYISAVEALCNPEGCLIRTGPGLDGLTYVDGQHLSAAGAAYLAEKILPVVLGPHNESPQLGYTP